MKSLLVALLLIGTPYFVHAQVDDSFDLGLDDGTSEELSETGKEPSNSIKSEARQNRSIYILNQATSDSKAGAATKTEQNDASMVGSRAEELRKNRQRAEMETELKATEKIEESRLKDERRRSDTLFGERFNDLEKSGTATPAPVYAPVAPTPVNSGLDRQDLREELNYALKEKEARKKSTPTSSYVIGMVGMTEFPKADNIQGNGALGIGLGVEAQEKILVEGMFQYGSYRRTYPWPTDIEEYSGIGALKFQFSKGTIRPLAGALAVYSYRTYTDDFSYQNRQSNSSVLDAGILGGAQFTLTDDFALGAEFRYLWNVTSKTDGYYSTFFPNQQPLDNFNHYVFALTGRFNF